LFQKPRGAAVPSIGSVLLRSPFTRFLVSALLVHEAEKVVVRVFAERILSEALRPATRPGPAATVPEESQAAFEARFGRDLQRGIQQGLDEGVNRKPGVRMRVRPVHFR
jgi:hypothetical protein